MTSEEAWRNCLLLLHQCSKWYLDEQNFIVIVSAPLQCISSGPTLTVGIVNIFFQSHGTGKYAKSTGHLNFHFVP